jgi:hypothetical protein
MSGFKVEFSVINQLATPAFHAAPLAQRPAAGQVGRVFIDTDNPSTGMYRDTGTAWVQIAETAASDVDTLQNVTDNGNTTTNNITVGASNVPIGTIDVRRNTPALNNASDYGVVVQNFPTIPSGASFGSANINSLNGTQLLTFTGNAILSNQTVATAGMFTNTIGNTSPGTITINQSGTIRTIAAIQAFSYYNTAAATTISHNAGIRIATSYNSGAAAANVTNNYQILIQDSTAVAGVVNFTNRWGIYQEGSSDLNYLAGNLLVKTTVNSGQALVVNGTAKATNYILDEQAAPATPATGTGIIYAKTDGLPYFKNDGGIEYPMVSSTNENLTTLAFQALGSTFKGMIPTNPGFIVPSSIALASTNIYFISYYLPTAQTITGVKFFQQLQGNYTASNYNGVGLYSFSAGNLTLVASTTNDGNFWKGSAVTWQTKPFSSTYSAAAGIYFIAVLYNSSAVVQGPSVGATSGYSTPNASIYDFTNSAKTQALLAGQTSLPASQTSSGLTNTTSVPLMALY